MKRLFYASISRKYKGLNLLTWAALALALCISVIFPGHHAIAAGAGFAGMGGMIYDARNMFCNKTALNTGGVASYLIGDVIDLGVGFNNTLINRDLGQGGDVYLIVSVDTSCLSATGKVKFHLCSDAQAAIAVDGSASYHFSSAQFLQAGLTAGTVLLSVPLPSGVVYERYLGIVQETITAAFTAGKVNAYLSCDPYGKKTAYPDAL